MISGPAPSVAFVTAAGDVGRRAQVSLIKRTLRPVILGVLLLVAAVGLLAQTPQTAANGLIAGRVVDAITGAPVDEAIVTLQGATSPAATAISVMADSQGRFVFRILPKGPFQLTARRDDFITGTYGQPWPPAGPGALAFPLQRLEVGENERVIDVSIKLWKLASLSGRVLDQTGQPVVGVTVRALNKVISGGRPTLTFETWNCGGACSSARTDDRGAFRFGRLQPADYVVAVPSLTISAPSSLQRRFSSDPIGTGRSAALFETTIGGMEWLGGGGTIMSAPLRGPNDRIALADYDRTVPIAALTDDGELFIYPTQFFSSTGNLADSQSIRLSAGENRTDINFNLRPAKTVTVSGTLSDARGPLSDYLLRLVPVGQELLMSDPEVAQAVSESDGNFMFAGVTPGDYFIRSMRRPPNPTSPEAPSQRSQWGESRIAVGDSPLSGVTVRISDLPVVSGRIEFAGNSPRPQRVPSPYIERADGRRPGSYMFLTRATAQNGFTTTQGQIPGRYLVQIASVPVGWYLRSAMWQGRDVSDVPFEIGSVDISDIVVTFADAPSTVVNGSVQDRSGAPAGSAVVVVFPADSARWLDQGPKPRRFAQVSTTRNGTFTVSNLPAGDYLIAALQDAAPFEWQDPSVLRKLIQEATKLSVRNGETATIPLRAFRWAR